jgi:hypothetical protein
MRGEQGDRAGSAKCHTIPTETNRADVAVGSFATPYLPLGLIPSPLRPETGPNSPVVTLLVLCNRAEEYGHARSSESDPSA